MGYERSAYELDINHLSYSHCMHKMSLSLPIRLPSPGARIMWVKATLSHLAIRSFQDKIKSINGKLFSSSENC